MDNNQKKNFRKIETSEQEFEQRLRTHRHRVARLIALSAGAIILIFCLSLLYLHFRSYNSYQVKEEIKRNDNPDVEYRDYSGNLLKYSRDGAFLIDTHGKLIWNQTFEMNKPIVDIADQYVGIAAEGGTELYISSIEKVIGKIETSMPIVQIKVSGGGFVAVLLEENENYYVTLYDKEGSQLAHGEYHIENSGIPIAMALSKDCKQLAISFLDVKEGIVKSTVHIYDFTENGKAQIDNQVAEFSYEGEMAIQMNYLDDKNLLILTDQKAILISDEGKPKQEKTITYDGKVSSVFCKNGCWGFVSSYNETTKEGSSKSGERLTVYNENGKIVFQKDVFSKDVRVEVLESEFVAVIAKDKIQLYNSKGLLKFRGNFPSEIVKIKSLDTDRDYLVLLDDQMIRIKLK